MPVSTTIVPFRWDVSRPHELGALADAEPAPAYPAFADDLRACCAAVLAAAGDVDLVFVGRSPESMYDYLRGACFDTSWRDRMALLLVSLRARRAPTRDELAAMHGYLATVGLDPRDVARRRRPLALVDLVCEGGTFHRLAHLLHARACHTRADWRAARRKLRIVAITARDPERRHEWSGALRRRVTGGGLLPRTAAANVTVDARLWNFLGNRQPKLTDSHAPQSWADPRVAAPPAHTPHLRSALRAAADLFRHARDRPERLRFISDLARHGALRHAALRTLAAELRFGRSAFILLPLSFRERDDAARPGEVVRLYGRPKRRRAETRTGSEART